MKEQLKNINSKSGKFAVLCAYSDIGNTSLEEIDEISKECGFDPAEIWEIKYNFHVNSRLSTEHLFKNGYKNI